MNMKVIGVGGGGCNLLNHLMKTKKIKAEFIAVNTDYKCLRRSKAHKKVQLGPKLCRGLGSGGNPVTANQAAWESAEDLRGLFEHTQLVCFLACLGGGTGTGATPVLAQLAREAGAKVFSIVTLPFCHEGPIRHSQAQVGLGVIQDQSDMLVKFPNEQLDLVADLKKLDFSEIFGWQDERISRVVLAAGDLFHGHESLRLDFEEWKDHVGSSTHVWMGVATAWGANRFTQSVADVIRNPLVEEIKFTQADRLFLMVAFNEMTHDQYRALKDAVKSKAPQGCKVRVGLANDPAMKKDEIRLSLWAANA